MYLTFLLRYCLRLVHKILSTDISGLVLFIYLFIYFSLLFLMRVFVCVIVYDWSIEKKQVFMQNHNQKLVNKLAGEVTTSFSFLKNKILDKV